MGIPTPAEADVADVADPPETGGDPREGEAEPEQVKEDPVPEPPAPDATTRPDLDWSQVLPAEAGLPDPSLERLEPLTEYEGVAIEFYEMLGPEGSVRLQGHRSLASDGKRGLHGPEWRWFENGQIRLRRNYLDGRVTGPFLEWFDTGYLKSTGDFLNDRLDGEWVRWYPLGVIRSLRNYSPLGYTLLR